MQTARTTCSEAGGGGRSFRPWLSLMLSAMALAPIPVDAAPVCRPSVAIAATHLQRGGVSVAVVTDARRCASLSGRFEIAFVSLRENTPDETFALEETWSEGLERHVLALSYDETIEDVWIRYVSPCPCRDIPAESREENGAQPFSGIAGKRVD